MKKNDVIELEITGMTAEGSGVGRADGMAVFVADAAVGDKILAHILKVKKTYAYAKIDEIIAPSPDREKPDCAVSRRCGGCVYRHISYAAELRAKQQRVEDAFLRIGGLPLKINKIIGATEQDGYRNKAQFPVGRIGDKTQLGFFSPRSHTIVDCEECRLQPPEYARIAAAFRQWADEYNIPVYDERSGKGLLRHLYLRSSAGCGELLVCVVINGSFLPRATELAERVFALGATGLVLNINKAQTNVILGEKCITLRGKGTVTDALCGVEFELSPVSFYQVNREQAQRLYTLAAEYAQLDESTTLLDMYCGAGTIGLTMAKKVKSLIGVEIVPAAVEDAKRNAQRNGITNARFICADAAQAAAQLRDEGIRPDVIVLDPPRKGCEPQLIETVASMSPSRIVYVSCDPATLARDCSAFASHGYSCPEKDSVNMITPVDMFPRTAHVECVVMLSKNEEKYCE